MLCVEREARVRGGIQRLRRGDDAALRGMPRSRFLLGRLRFLPLVQLQQQVRPHQDPPPEPRQGERLHEYVDVVEEYDLMLYGSSDLIRL